MKSASRTSDATELMDPDDLERPGLEDDGDMLHRGGRLGDYVVERAIGRGGGGVVYSAHHAQLGTRVAIKLLHSEMATFPVMLARFAREVEALRKLAHPNIVELYEVGEVEPGRPYYVMELLEGPDLRMLLSRCGRFSMAETLELLRPICEAVEAAHRAGIIHRDLKANNVLVVERSGARTVKLLDFGIAKLLRSESTGQGLTEPGAVIGTAHNMAPEQVRCEPVDERTDIYALGVLIFQLLTGQYPFQADDPHRVALLHLTAPPPRPSQFASVSPALDAVVLRCLEKQPERRFASAGELFAALLRAADEPLPASEESAAEVLGVYIELSQEGDEELDDAQIDELALLLDGVELDLANSGFVLPLRTTSGLLGVRPKSEPGQDEPEHEAIVRALWAEVSARAAHAARIRVELAWTVADVRYRESDDGIEIVSGPVLDVDSWRPGAPHFVR